MFSPVQVGKFSGVIASVISLSAVSIALAAPTTPVSTTTAAPADPPPVLSTFPNETPAQREARMKWFHAARFGMFIHWGVYSVPAGVYKDKRYSFGAEWIMNFAKIPVADYRAYAPNFTADKYDPEAWVKMAKDAGMKYIVITAKHHEGFALFDSKVTDWDAVDAGGAHRDLLAPLIKAARKAGLRVGLYYSQAQDWVHTGGSGNSWDPTHNGDMDVYLKNIALPQVKELLTNYGPIDVFWWDTAYGMNRERAAPFAELLKTQPGIISNNRLGGGFKGDTETPEQFIPGKRSARDFETCMTMNDSWGYTTVGDQWKSSETLIRNLIDIASKGGNYLLNVSPTSEGIIPQPEVDRLAAIGAWMKANNTAIYDTEASPLGRLPWGRCTQKSEKGKTTLYLHVFDWPQNGQLQVPGLFSKPNAAQVLVGGQAIACAVGTRGLSLTLPATAPDAVSSTLVLQFKRAPQIVIPPLEPDANGLLAFNVDDATINGNNLKSDPKTQTLRFNANADGVAGWDVHIDQPGEFEVSGEVAAKDASNLRLQAGTSVLPIAVTSSGSASTYAPVTFGRVALSTGMNPLRLQLGKGGTAVNVKNLTLKRMEP